MEYLEGLSLGKDVSYIDRYSPELLMPVARHLTRENLGLDPENLPFKGFDVWNAYEISWLNPKGLPQVAIGVFSFSCESAAIIESKSFKLYLNSFNQTAFSSVEEVARQMQYDLSAACGGSVSVSLYSPEDWQALAVEPILGAQCIDEQDITIESYEPVSDYLVVENTDLVEEQLCSHLLRSLCPVTGQPDWASVYIRYKGAVINRAGLLRYIVGFRLLQEFHEQCVERIYRDIMAACQPEYLEVFARYVRRGGLDINPYRASADTDFQNQRLVRQ